MLSLCIISELFSKTMNNKDDGGDNLTTAGLILRILKNPRLLLIALPILGVATFIYVKYFIDHPTDDGTHPPPSTCRKWTLSGRLMSESHQYLNLKSVKVGIESGPFSDDDQITDGIFRITNVALPEDNFIQLYLEHKLKMYLFYRRPFDSTQIKIDNNSCTLIFLDNLEVPKDILDSITDPITTPGTFSINISDDSIRRIIARKSGLTYEPGSVQNRIIVTYDPGRIKYEPNSDIYTFERSCPIILINGAKFTLNNCFIQGYTCYSHQKECILEYCNKESIATSVPFIKRNLQLIDNWLNSLKH